MRKIIVAFYALLFSAAVYADIRSDLEAIERLATTDVAAAQAKMRNRIFNPLKYSSRYRALRLEFDKKLADKGLALNWWDTQSYPCLSENERKKLGLDKSLAGTVAIARKYKCNITPYGLIKMAKMTPDEAVTVFNEFIYRLDHIDTEWLKVFSSYFAEHAKKNGTTAQFLEAISKPYYGGMNDYLASIGATNKIVDISKIWSRESIARLKEKVLKGDFPLTDSFALRLEIALGIDEYNKFIDEYMEVK